MRSILISVICITCSFTSSSAIIEIARPDVPARPTRPTVKLNKKMKMKKKLFTFSLKCVVHQNRITERWKCYPNINTQVHIHAHANGNAHTYSYTNKMWLSYLFCGSMYQFHQAGSYLWHTVDPSHQSLLRLNRCRSGTGLCRLGRPDVCVHVSVCVWEYRCVCVYICVCVYMCVRVLGSVV